MTTARARFGSLITFALQNLRLSMGRSLALGFGIAATLAVLGATVFFSDALVAEALRSSAQSPDILVARFIAGRPAPMQSEDAARFVGIPAVAAVTPRIWGYFYSSALQGNITIVGVPSGKASVLANANAFAEGRDLEVGKHEIVLGQAIATALGVRVGDTITLPIQNRPTAALTLVGTLKASLDWHTADVIFADESDARAQLGYGVNEISDIAITLSNTAESHLVATKAVKVLVGVRAVERTELERVYTIAYGRRSGLMLLALLPSILTLLLLVLDKLSGVSPREQRQIAILKSIGWSTRDVLAVKLLEMVAVAALSSAIGLLIAYFWAFSLNAAGLRHALMGFGVFYPEHPLAPAVDAAQVIGLLAAVVGPVVALAVVPAWRAAQADPLGTLRSTT
jgi:ABC-type lipoprotein release transport system permease subunit